MISNLDSGGVSKAMVNLLTEIDRERYDITLWVGTPGGLYEDLLPKDIRVIRDRRTALLLAGTRGLIPLLREGHIMLAAGSCVRLLLACFSKAWAGWWLSRLLPRLSREYDVAIDYNGQHQLYYMVDRLQAKNKISFFHNDYSKWTYYYSMDKRYYTKVQHICTISQTCLNSLIRFFPQCAAKLSVIQNIVAPDVVKELSRMNISEMELQSVALVTVGHVCERKGSDIAIEAAAILKAKGIRFKWYFIGSKKGLTSLENEILEYRLHDELIFLGTRQNPYPYMRRATVIVHPSRYEGKSIALDEAKILCKPIVVTNFSTVRDQFENGVNATICDMTPESLSNAIIDLLQDPDKRNRYSSWLRQHPADNRGSINKLYALIDES